MKYQMSRKILNYRWIVPVLTIIFILLYFVINPKLIFIIIFSLIYISIIYYKFSKSNIEFLYFTLLLLLIIDFSFSIEITKSIKIYYYHILIFIFIIIGAINLHKQKGISFKNIIKLNKYNVFITIFLIYAIISILWAPNKLYAIKYIFIYFNFFIVLMIISRYNKSMKNIKKTITFLIYLFVGIELGGLFEIFGVRFGMRNHFIEAGYSLADAYIKRIPVVFFFNPNDYAFYLVIMLIIINVFIMFSEKLKEKLKLLIIFSIGQVNLIFTASRTGWICFILSSIITAFVIFMCNIEKSKKYKYIKSQIILLTYIIIFFFVFSINTISRPYFGKIESIPYVGKIYSINSIKSNDNSNENKNKVDKNNNLELGGKGSNNERYTLIYNVINGIFIKKHYLGYGVGNSVVLEASFNNTNDILNVHSFWFEILADFGVIIFLYLLYIYINLILGLSKLSKKSKNIIFSMFLIINIVSLIILIPLSFASSSIISHTIFWIALGLSYSSIKDKNIQQINV